MKNTLLLFFLGISLLLNIKTVFAAESLMPPIPIHEPSLQTQEQNTVEAEKYSSGRGTYRSPGGGFTGGNPGGAAPGYRTGPRTPTSDVTRPRQPNVGQPSTPTSGWGRFFGGVAVGALLGHMLNPFGGYGYAGGFSFLSLIFWALIIYLGYKLFQRFRRRND